MASYVGETFEITNTALDFDTSALTPAQVTSVVVEVVNATTPTSVQVATAAMTWDSARGLWFYLWNTAAATPPAPGSYIARVTLTGLDGTASFGYLKIRLKAPLF